jgi:hypothetical protein
MEEGRRRRREKRRNNEEWREGRTSREIGQSSLRNRVDTKGFSNFWKFFYCLER